MVWKIIHFRLYYTGMLWLILRLECQLDNPDFQLRIHYLQNYKETDSSSQMII